MSEDRLRELAYDNYGDPLTAEEREWCVNEAVWAAEGGYQATDLTPLTDSLLARAVIESWWDYARSNVL